MKNKRRKRATRQVAVTKTATRSVAGKMSTLVKVTLWLVTSGIALAVVAVANDYFRSAIRVSHEKSVDLAQELQLTNTWPIDRKIISLTAKFAEDPTFRLLDGQIVLTHAYGRMDLPDYPRPYETNPAETFNAMDGTVLQAKSSTKFRLPPFTSIPILKLEGGVVDVTVTSMPTSKAMQFLESMLGHVGFKRSKDIQRFLIQGGYWTAVSENSKFDVKSLRCTEEWQNPSLPGCFASGRSGDPSDELLVDTSQLEWGAQEESAGDETAEECMNQAMSDEPFTTILRNRYVVGGKVRGTALRKDGTGRPLILWVVAGLGTKVICMKGRLVFFYASMEAIKSFRKLPPLRVQKE